MGDRGGWQTQPPRGPRGGYQQARGGRGGGPPGRGQGQPQGNFRGQPQQGGYQGPGRAQQLPQRGGRGGGFGGRGRGGGGPGIEGRAVVHLEGNDVPPQDPTIAAAEKAIMDQAPSATPADPKTLNHPIRPGYLNAGTAFQLLTNAFPIRTKSGVKLHRYDIVRVRGVRWQKRDEQSDISRKPPDTPKDPTGRRRKQVISLFLTEGVSAEYRNQMASDFSTFIISAKEITKNGVQVLEPTREVGCKGDFETTFAPWYAVYNVELKKTTEWDLDVLINYLVTANSRDGSVSYEGFRQVLNVILGTWAKLQPDQMIMSLGQQHYRQHDTQGNFNGILLDGIIAASRGYVSSARYSGGTLLAQVQIKHAPIYHQINMLEVINDMSQRARRPWAQISTAIKGIVVKLLHLPPIDTTRGFSVYPTRTVIGLAMMDDTKKATKQKANPPKVNQDFGSADHVRFFNSASKKYETVREYFKKQHKKDLGPGNEAIVLKLGSEESPVYVPAKFCEIREGQPYRTTLSGFQTQRMLRTAARRPNENAASIQGDSHNALNLGGPIVAAFGLAVQTKLMTVPARILPSPPVRYTIRPPPNSNQEKASTETRDVHVDHGKWILGGLSFNRYSKLTNPKGGHTWLALNLGSPNPARLQAIQRQMQQFQAELHGLGVKVGPFGPTENLQVNRDFAATLMPKLRALKRDGLQLVVIVLPGDKDIGLYKTIKQVADVKVGIHNVVVRAEDRKQNGFLNCGVEYLANIGQKMSLKLGGWNQSVQDLGIINDGRTMLMGLDVTHPAPGSSDEAPSVAAMVATTGPDCQQFPAVLKINSAKIELVDTAELEVMTKTCLERWARAQNKVPPNKIIIYRDGVSEGMYKSVVEKEYLTIRDIANKFCANLKHDPPKITVIICGKRHHTRFYPVTRESAFTDQFSNPKAGTCVDRYVTDARDWDFYLQSHQAIQGTAKPCHYVVIHDEIFNPSNARSQDTANEVIRLTHALCHMYGRATKAVSVCPPAYYADRAADRARIFLAGWFDDQPNMTPQQRRARQERLAAMNPAQRAQAEVAEAAQRQAARTAQNAAMNVHPDLADTMFYV